MKTKILALVLAMLMLLSLVACNNSNNDNKDGNGTTASTDTTGNGDNGDTTTGDKKPGQTPDEWGSHLPTDTYDDEEFTFLFRASNRYLNGIYAENDVTNTSVEKAVYERLANIETTYKIKFFADTSTGSDASDMITAVGNLAKSGTDPFEVFGGHAQGTPWSLAINGNLYEWGDLPLIQLDAEYWSQNAKEQFSTPGGKVYFMTGDISYWTVAAAFCMFFNKDIVDNVQDLESPYDKVRNEEWTFETFAEYVTTLESNMSSGDSSSTIETGDWGYVTSNTRGPCQILVTTKYPMLAKDDTTKTGYKSNMTKQVFEKAVADFIALGSTGSAYLSDSMNYTELKGAFTSGRSAFYDDEVYFATDWTAAGMNFGVLPWPKYNEDTELYNSMVNAGNDSFGIPINTTERNAQRISVVLENMAYHGTEIVEFYYNVILTYQDVKDEDSIEMMDHIHKGVNFDFGYYYNPGSLCTITTKCKNNKSSLSTTYKSIEGQVNDALMKWSALDEE